MLPPPLFAALRRPLSEALGRPPVQPVSFRRQLRNRERVAVSQKRSVSTGLFRRKSESSRSSASRLAQAARSRQLAPPRPPDPYKKYCDRLIKRLLPFHVQPPPAKGRSKWRRILMMQRIRARRTNRQRRRERRKTEMLREQPYQVSRLVLDLDAIDCPGVRPYSLQDEIEQRDLWGTNPEMDALFQRMVRVKEEIRVSKMKWQAEVRQYDPKRITERDVLAVAFFGAPHDSDVTGNAQVAAQAPPLGYVTRGLLDSMGVTDRIADDVHHTVHMLLRRLREQPSLTVPSEPFREFADTLGKTEDVALVERIVAPLLQTGWGRAMVSRCRDEIVGACVRANRLVLDDGAWRVYRFLKSLSAGLAANGLKFDLASSAAVRQLEDRLFGQHLGLLRGQHGVLGLQQ